MPIRYKNTATKREASVPTPDEAAAKADLDRQDLVRKRQQQIIDAMDRSTRWDRLPERAPKKRAPKAPESDAKKRTPRKRTPGPEKRTVSAKGTLRADGTIGE